MGEKKSRWKTCRFLPKFSVKSRTPTESNINISQDTINRNESSNGEEKIFKKQVSFTNECIQQPYSERDARIKQLKSIRKLSGFCESVTEAYDPVLDDSYEKIPLLKVLKLPRGGVSVETEAVGSIQYGIPPETIKDSMRLGLDVPSIYIVPVERFCRHMGAGLGINVAEFEFPAYYNFFMQGKRCTLIIDSDNAEKQIRRVFSETLLGPKQFRCDNNPIPNEDEDFAPDFPLDERPNFEKELRHFRTLGGNELVVESFLNFGHFIIAPKGGHVDIGLPPPLEAINSSDEKFRLNDMRKNERRREAFSYSQAKKFGEVSQIYPSDATPEEIETNSCKRVEIFKMSGGVNYIMHDINEENIIVGKVIIKGYVHVSKSLSVHGFGNVKENQHDDLMRIGSTPSAFYPPSFGVTVLGNSHGFDKSGSVSGYVLWINGRGIMIDPPPYSSEALEREGIRRRTIVAIILTHCHADHDAGAFQKVLSGSPIVVLTTPTIYKSFIRKYAALSSLSPNLLRHSHRHKPAIIGLPLRFQGATFHFSYMLHSIPCIGFRVEWHGRSMVFTGDHFNSPDDLIKLNHAGVLSKARLEGLMKLPLQETDLLLHESGAAPIHTPLEVLLKLPPKVKKRLYVVHTSALPENCELRVAPTGTAGTIRLDEIEPSPGFHTFQSCEYSKGTNDFNLPPRVALRQPSSTDAWFILNLLSTVPFISTLPYSSTMELLETSQVYAFCMNDVVVPVSRRKEVLCVVWEGVMIEQCRSTGFESVGNSCERNSVDNQRRTSTFQADLGKHRPLSELEMMNRGKTLASWNAGDWTGPISLQPNKRLSGDSSSSETHDIIAMAEHGVKIITVEFTDLHRILYNGSSLYRKYLSRRTKINNPQKKPQCLEGNPEGYIFADAVNTLNVTELLKSNSAFRNIPVARLRQLECLAEGPVYFPSGDHLWTCGAPVDKAYIIVAGTVSFCLNRRFASIGSGRPVLGTKESVKYLNLSAVSNMAADAEKVRSTLGLEDLSDSSSISSSDSVGSEDDKFTRSLKLLDTNNVAADQDYVELSKGLKVLAHNSAKSIFIPRAKRRSSDTSISGDSLFSLITDEGNEKNKKNRSSINKSIFKQHANKAYLERLYTRSAIVAGLVFSRGHFLADIFKMVDVLISPTSNDNFSVCGDAGASNDPNHRHESTLHSTTLVAGNKGCIVLEFSKASLVPFLDDYPGLLFALLGTFVVL